MMRRFGRCYSSSAVAPAAAVLTAASMNPSRVHSSSSSSSATPTPTTAVKCCGFSERRLSETQNATHTTMRFVLGKAQRHLRRLSTKAAREKEKRRLESLRQERNEQSLVGKADSDAKLVDAQHITRLFAQHRHQQQKTERGGHGGVQYTEGDATIKSPSAASAHDADDDSSTANPAPPSLHELMAKDNRHHLSISPYSDVLNSDLDVIEGAYAEDLQQRVAALPIAEMLLSRKEDAAAKRSRNDDRTEDEVEDEEGGTSSNESIFVPSKNQQQEQDKSAQDSVRGNVANTRVKRLDVDTVSNNSLSYFKANDLADEIKRDQRRQRIPADSRDDWTTDRHATEVTLQYFKRFPINHMIPNQYAVIIAIRHPDAEQRALSNNTRYSEEEEEEVGQNELGAGGGDRREEETTRSSAGAATPSAPMANMNKLPTDDPLINSLRKKHPSRQLKSGNDMDDDDGTEATFSKSKSGERGGRNSSNDDTMIIIPRSEQKIIPISEARAIAAAHGMDLIRMETNKATDRYNPQGDVAVCHIDDHAPNALDWLEYYFAMHGVRPGKVRDCYEVSFSGGTKPHAVNFKAYFISKYLFQRHPVKISLTKFGTAREGFLALEAILDVIKQKCETLNAWHSCGKIEASYAEIWCYLHPATARRREAAFVSPAATGGIGGGGAITDVAHPSKRELSDAMQLRLFEEQREQQIDNLGDIPGRDQRAHYKYQGMLSRGTAWTFRGEGLSMKKQRKMKVMGGFLPKGTKLHEARGDVDMPYPYKFTHPTSVEHRVSFPRESNIDQAQRGASAILKRSEMSISEMHDLGEVPENETVLDDYNYTVGGDALEIGSLKERMGIKKNRRKVPKFAAGFATMGVQEPDGVERARDVS